MPRSPSRDLADRYLGNRDYFRQPDWIRRTKHWLALVALGLSVGWLVFDRVGQRAVSFHTHGPLADPHAALDANCEACHQGYSASDFSLRSVFHTRDRWRTLTCEKCHAGPPHHENVAAEPDGKLAHTNCSNCHHDHAGRAASLTRIPDDHCTRCHADLPAHTKDHVSAVAPPYQAKVTSFAANHPEFRVLAEAGDKPYPGRRVKFSHALHMTPGLVYHRDNLKAGVIKDKKDAVWTLDRLEKMSGPEAAARYEKWSGSWPGTDQKLLQLKCASCHQLDSELPGDPYRPGTADKVDPIRKALLPDPPNALLPPRAAGAYYLPVNFEAHCRACHPLQAPDTASGPVELKRFDLPHRVQPAELRKVLEGQYAERLAALGHKAADLPLGPPRERLDKLSAPEVTTFRQEVNRLSDATMRLLLAGELRAEPAEQYRVPERSLSGGYTCGKCHFTEKGQIAPVPNKTVWFAHAKFDHVSHRGLTCASCHPATDSKFDEGGPTAVVEIEPVRIAGIKTCQECHAPSRTVKVEGKPSFVGGGARQDCTLCHRYHNNDHPLQGRGATPRDPDPNPDNRMSIEQFLRGKKD